MGPELELTVRVLGWRVLDVRLRLPFGPDAVDDDAEDPGVDLSGGTTGVALVVEAGDTDRLMGFTNGLDAHR